MQSFSTPRQQQTQPQPVITLQLVRPAQGWPRSTSQQGLFLAQSYKRRPYLSCRGSEEAAREDPACAESSGLLRFCPIRRCTTRWGRLVMPAVQVLSLSASLLVAAVSLSGSLKGVSATAAAAASSTVQHAQLSCGWYGASMCWSKADEDVLWSAPLASWSCWSDILSGP